MRDFLGCGNYSALHDHSVFLVPIPTQWAAFFLCIVICHFGSSFSSLGSCTSYFEVYYGLWVVEDCLAETGAFRKVQVYKRRKDI